MRISDPSSKEYGQHLSQDEVSQLPAVRIEADNKQLVKFFAPAEHAIDRVTTWLKSSGIENVELDRGRHWLNFMATVAQLEDLLHTEYKFYAAPSGKQAIACDEYSVPGDLQRYIDLVQPTIHLTAAGVVDKKKQPIPKRDSSTGLPSLGSPDDPSLPKKGPNKPPSNSTGVSHEVVFWACADQMTPGCLRALYGIPPTGHLPPRPAPDVPLTTFGVVEFDPQSYLPDDFDPFYKQFEPDVPAGTRPVLLSVDGGALQTNQQGSDFNTESNLDLQYAISLGKSIST